MKPPLYKQSCVDCGVSFMTRKTDRCRSCRMKAKSAWRREERKKAKKLPLKLGRSVTASEIMHKVGGNLERLLAGVCSGKIKYVGYK